MSTYTKFAFDTCHTTSSEEATMRRLLLAEAEAVPDGNTADGLTVHAVFARDGAKVAKKVLELSVGHADNGRQSEYPALPGWQFKECANVVTAHYVDRDEPLPGGVSWQVPVVRWTDPAWGGDGKVEYSAFWRYPQGQCVWCGGEVAHGYCQVCGAT